MTEVSEKKFSTKNLSSPVSPQYKRSQAGKRWSANVPYWQPPTDMYETESSVFILVEIAGMSESEIVISLEKRTLVISGERANQVVTGACHQLEIMSGEFITVVELPVPVQYEKIAADYVDGFLTIVLPKEESVRVEVLKK